MGGLAWILVLFAVNVVLVLVFGLLIEVRRRRDQHEIGELERLWSAPAASFRMIGDRGGGVRVRGKHVAVVEQGAGPRGGLGTVSLVVALLAVASVLVAAVLDPSSEASRERSSAVETPSDSFVGGVIGADGRPTGARPGEGAEVGGDGRAPRTAQDGQVGSQAPAAGTDEAASEAGTVSSFVAAMPASSSSIRLTWNEVPAATGYEVERRPEVSGEDWLTIVTTPASVSTYTDDGLAGGTTYYYRVTALLEHGAAPPSDVVSATTATPPPPAPPTLIAKVKSYGILLVWTDVEGEIGYRIERQTDDGTDWTGIGTTGEGIAEYQDGLLSPGMTYRYRVVAIGPGGESPASNVVEATASAGPDEAPPGPSDDDVSTKPGKGSHASQEHAATP
jgi:hypothetical protein